MGVSFQFCNGPDRLNQMTNNKLSIIRKIPAKAIRMIRQFHQGVLMLPYNIIFLWINNIQYSKRPILGGLPIVTNAGKITLGNNVSIASSARNNLVSGKTKTCIGVGKNGILTIGNNVGISNSAIFALESIVIEDEVLIGGGAAIYDSDFHSILYHQRIQRPDTNIKSAPVIIRKGAFIGTEAIIMKGVEIGARSVIAAGSVVTKSIPPDEIWGGNPAKFIKKIDNQTT